jgi:hypothetical protein
MEQYIQSILSRMTLEDRISLCNGADFWHSKAMERYGIPAFTMADGPHGLRVQRADAGMMDALNQYLTLINQRMAAENDKARFKADDVTLKLNTTVKKYGRTYDFSQELERAKQYAAKLIESHISQAGVNLNDYDRVLYTGGGSVALRNYLSMPHNARVNPRAQVGNAEGYVKFLSLKGV